MPIEFHPKTGSVILCNFDDAFKVPEMVKRRPVIVLSPQITQRPRLCTVVAISTEEPIIKMPFHWELKMVLPEPWAEGPNWVKGDMIYSVGFHRLDLMRIGRDNNGKRLFGSIQLEASDLKAVRKAVLCGLGLASLTKHLS